MGKEPYVPNELLSRRVGDRMYSVEFVLNDYVQLRFDGASDDGPVVLNCYVGPVVQTIDRLWHERDLGYADALRRLTPGTVTSTSEDTGAGIRIELDTGAVVIHPAKEDVYVEVAELRGFHDRAWMVWRPGEESFQDLTRPDPTRPSYRSPAPPALAIAATFTHYSLLNARKLRDRSEHLAALRVQVFAHCGLGGVRSPVRWPECGTAGRARRRPAARPPPRRVAW